MRLADPSAPPRLAPLQQAPQPSSHKAIDRPEHVGLAVLEIPIPAPQAPVHVRDDHGLLEQGSPLPHAAPAIDVLAAELGLKIETPQAIKTVNMALLTGAAVEVHDPFGLVSNRIPNARGLGPDSPLVARVFVDDRLLDAPPGALILRPPSLVAGIGCNRGTAADEIRELLLATLRNAGLCRVSLRGLASIDLKADEPGLIALAQELCLPLEFFGREEINRVEDAVQTPSAMVEKHIGVKSVCEATAILATHGGELIVPKRTTRNATVAIARVNFTS